MLIVKAIAAGSIIAGGLALAAVGMSPVLRTPPRPLPFLGAAVASE